MNNRLKYATLLPLLFLINQAFTQTTIVKKRDPNPLVAEITNRNELTLNVAPLVGLYTSGGLSNEGFLMSFGYSRNFGKNHYLRGGIKVVPVSVDINPSGNDNTINTFFNTETFRSSSSQHIANFTDTAMTGYSDYYKICSSIYVGYDHLFGKRRTRFLLGIDVFAGLTYANYNEFREYYQVAYSLDSPSNRYSSNSTYINSTGQSISTVNFHFGFSPRIGLRFEVSKRIALSAIASPMLYFDNGYYQYTEKGFVAQTGLRFSAYLLPGCTELGIIFKL